VEKKMPAIDARNDRKTRIERVRENSIAALNGESSEERTRKREARADDWARWLRHRMDDKCCTAEELLPDILAKMDQTIDDRVAAAIRQLKGTLRKALVT
jgi:hypothetical protein